MDIRAILRVPAVDIMPMPTPAPAVVHENVQATLILLNGVMAALNSGGWQMEFEPYNRARDLAESVIVTAYPKVNAAEVVRDRIWYPGGLTESLAAALAAIES